MKRAILVLMIVVFALVTVVPAFAMPQDFHGVIVPQIIDPNDSIVMPDGIIIIDGVIVNDGGEVKAGVIMEDGVIVEYARLNFTRKAGGEQQDYL